MPTLVRGFIAFMVLLILLVIIEKFYGKIPIVKKVAIVRLEGVIDEVSKREFQDLLKEALDRDDIAGIVISINSPGGSVVPSQELYDFIMKAKSKKPIYSYISSIGASGAYYVAASTDKIYAERGSLVGSIGVIFTIPELEKLVEKIGIRMVVVKSGKFKDTGSPFREMTEEDRRYVEKLVMDVYNQFVEDVSKGRKLPIGSVRELADGRVFTGVEAKRLRLVDEVGTMDDAVLDISKRLGYSKALETEVIEKREEFWEKFRSIVTISIREFLKEILVGGMR